jgi:DNA helicase-2/ATP-dependent DNA helicase PcrA
LDAARESGLVESISKRTAVAVAKFVALFDHLSLLAGQPVEEILGHVLEESGYQQVLEDSEDEYDQERLANVQELLSAARQFDEQNPGPGQLEAFLEQSSLVSDTDAWELDDDRATLMTMHAAKGLEFPVVFITAIEEGLLPHERSRDQQDLVEEERRLLFVGITRAQEELHLSMATYREYRGQRRMSVPSPFLMELPRDQMQVVEPGGAWSRARLASQEFNQEEAADDLDFDPARLEAMPTCATGSSAPGSAGGLAPREPAAPTATLTTAAQLQGTSAGQLPPVAPEVFHQGMLVVHPEYGLGKVVALAGSGARRTASVAFVSPPAEKKFMLAQSPLRPAKS